MSKASEVTRVIQAIAKSHFDAARKIIEDAKYPGTLQAACSLIYLAEIGVQLREIANALKAIRRAQTHGVEPSLP